MHGFITSNPIYISALKNDRNFTQVKPISLTDTTTEISLGKSNIYKIMLKKKSLSRLSLGDTFNLGKYQVESEDPQPIEWQIVHQTTDYQVAHTTHIIDCRCFDAKEPKSNDSDRKSKGNNKWSVSNIKQFLNSDQAIWYSAQHQYDQAPNSNTYTSGNTTYESHKGFLYHWTNKDKSYLKDMSFSLYSYGESSYTWTGKVWLPTVTQMGYGTNDNINEGTRFDMYTTTANKIKKFSKQCVENNKYCITNNKTTGNTWMYFLSSGLKDSSSNVWRTNSNGNRYSDPAYYGGSGIAPCICLSRDFTLDETISFTISKKSNGKTTNLGTMYLDNNGIGALCQDITLTDNESLVVTCDSTIDAEYELIVFHK